MNKEMIKVKDNVDDPEAREEFTNFMAQYINDVVGSESYGDFVEFFDEDGCVLFTVRAEDGKLVFNFADSSEDYAFVPKNLPEDVASFILS